MLPQQLRNLRVMVIGRAVEVGGQLCPSSRAAVLGALPQISGVGFVVLRQKRCKRLIVAFFKADRLFGQTGLLSGLLRRIAHAQPQQGEHIFWQAQLRDGI